MTELTDLLIATHNRDKIEEIAKIIGSLGVNVVDLSAYPEFHEVDETGTTLEENALLKARAAFEHTRLSSMADDTGLFVDALEGEPGVYSSRFAGPDATYDDNCRLLLERMEGVPEEKRSARFICIIALILPDGTEHLFKGEAEGMILTESKGKQGFGYDPVFYYPPFEKTFAEISLSEKNRISHRAIAVWKTARFIEGILRP